VRIKPHPGGQIFASLEANMPFPRWLARINLHFTNHLLGPLATRLPGMGIVLHVGRKTHRRYRTPVMVFRRDNRFIVALTYGRDSQWVQNVLAANGCQLETREHTVPLSHPWIFRDDDRENMPRFVRFFLRILNVSDFLKLTMDDHSAPQCRIAEHSMNGKSLAGEEKGRSNSATSAADENGKSATAGESLDENCVSDIHAAGVSVLLKSSTNLRMPFSVNSCLRSKLCQGEFKSISW
jgi:deazaflavin-dependent oxidoreductase (nitroreductase family)